MNTIRRTYRLPLATLQQIDRLQEAYLKKGSPDKAATEIVIQAIERFSEAAGAAKPIPCQVLTTSKRIGRNLYCRVLNQTIDYPSRCIKCRKV